MKHPQDVRPELLFKSIEASVLPAPARADDPLENYEEVGAMGEFWVLRFHEGWGLGLGVCWGLEGLGLSAGYSSCPGVRLQASCKRAGYQ